MKAKTKGWKRVIFSFIVCHWPFYKYIYKCVIICEADHIFFLLPEFRGHYKTTITSLKLTLIICLFTADSEESVAFICLCPNVRMFECSCVCTKCVYLCTCLLFVILSIHSAVNMHEWVSVCAHIFCSFKSIIALAHWWNAKF